MSAYNDLLVDAVCPSCAQRESLRFQMHTAASFDGDESGRFCLREYGLGERLAWWPPSDSRHSTWLESADDTATSPTPTEFCYGECTRCQAHLTAQVLYRDLRPTEIRDLALDRAR